MLHSSLLRVARSSVSSVQRLQGSFSESRRICSSILANNHCLCPPRIPPIRPFSSSATESKTTSYSPEEILEECSGLYDSLTSVNERLGGVAIPKSSHLHTSMPFCLLVGNHSSGKSSFINYVLQRNIQKAGVAPTDDTFTVIAPGSEDSDADGPTLIGDPDLGFASLRQFGPTLIHHTQLKNRTSRLNFMLVSGATSYFMHS